MPDGPGGLDARSTIFRERLRVSEELAALRTNRAEAIREATVGLLGEIRPVGGVTPRFTPRARSPLLAHVRTVAEWLPRAWTEASSEAGALRIKRAQRGFYLHREHTIALSGANEADILSTVSHELGHRMEYVIPGVRDLEAAFYARRTSGEPLQPLGAGYGKEEQTRVDRFAHPYIGKEYGGRAFELLSMGLEAVLFQRYDLSNDQEYRQFILGILAGV